MQKIKYIVFDMDGTLLDSLTDLHNSLNHCFDKVGFQRRTYREVRSFVGNGIRTLIERAVPQGTSEEKIEEIFVMFKEHYMVHCADFTAPYDGIMEMLDGLKKRGYRMAIVSNKADAAVKVLTEEFFGNYIEVAVGDMEGKRKKPAPDLVWLAMEQLGGATKENTIYVGDSEVDYETAVNSELRCISVLWGFRDRELLEDRGACCFASKPMDVVGILGEMKC